MSNFFEMRCPICGSEDHIEIFATVSVLLTADGTDADAAADGNHYWDDDSTARCDACNCLGKVKAFQLSEKANEPATSSIAPKHTPGPWSVDPDKPTEICVASDGAMIASTDFFGDGAATAVEANAAFIVRACNAHRELLEILREQTDTAQAVIDNWSSGDLAAAVNALEGLIEPARAIIAKTKPPTA